MMEQVLVTIIIVLVIVFGLSDKPNDFYTNLPVTLLKRKGAATQAPPL